MKRLLPTLTGFLLITGFLLSCNKQASLPSLDFVEESPFVYQDQELGLGDSVQVSLNAEWNGTDLLSTLKVRVNEQDLKSYSLDVESANFTFTLTKGPGETEVWEFVLTDVDGHKATRSITLTLDPGSGSGQIVFYESLTLGAQQNSERPGFLSIRAGQLYNLASAYQNQGEVDLLCYFTETDQMAICGPACDLDETLFPGSHNVVLWQNRNSTWFNRTELSAGDFAQVSNDGSFQDLFDEPEAAEKAIELTEGDVYAFKLSNQKLGLIWIQSVTGGIDGAVTFGVKVQE